MVEGQASVVDMPEWEGIVKGREALMMFLNGQCKAFIWAQMYRREIFTDIRFPVGYVYEDRLTVPYLFLAAPKVQFARYAGYNYRQRTGAITKTFQPAMIRNISRVNDMVGEIGRDLPGKDWQKALIKFKVQNVYAAILSALIHEPDYRKSRGVWRQCTKHLSLKELISCFGEMRNPVLAMAICKVSPLAFRWAFRNYFIKWHNA
jgi:hypothetical protein